MAKNIIHMKLPMENGLFTVPMSRVKEWYNIAKDILGDEYILIASPFEPSVVDGDFKLLNIECKEYSYNEIKDIIREYENIKNIVGID